MKTARYLFGVEGRRALISFVSRDTLFAFDLDGTLAPIVDDPDKATVPKEIIAGLEELKKWAFVVVITGRSCEDALARMGFVPHRIVGNHGIQGLPGWEAQEGEFRNTVLDWERQLRSSPLITRNPGVVYRKQEAFHRHSLSGSEEPHRNPLDVGPPYRSSHPATQENRRQICGEFITGSCTG